MRESQKGKEAMDIKVKRWGKGGRSVESKRKGFSSVCQLVLYQRSDQSDKQGEERKVHAVQLNVRE